MNEKAVTYRAILDPVNKFTLSSAENKKYKGFKDFLIKKQQEDSVNKLLAAKNPPRIGHILFYYLVFTLVDMAGAALAFAFEKEDYKKLLWMIPQRLIYRQLMYYIVFKSFNTAIKGELQGWGVLKRTGNVRPVPAV